MKFAIIGAGNMGGALARGLAKGSLVEVSDIKPYKGWMWCCSP